MMKKRDKNITIFQVLPFRYWLLKYLNYPKEFESLSISSSCYLAYSYLLYLKLYSCSWLIYVLYKRQNFILEVFFFNTIWAYANYLWKPTWLNFLIWAIIILYVCSYDSETTDIFKYVLLPFIIL